MAFLIDNCPPPTVPYTIGDLTIRSSGGIDKGGTYFWTRMRDGKGNPLIYSAKPGHILIVDSETANTNCITAPVRISFV